MPVSRVHFNLTLYCVHVISFVVGMCADDIRTTIRSKVNVTGKPRIGGYINRMQAIYCTSINDKFTLIERCRHGVTRYRSVITVNSNSNQNNSSRSNNNPDIQIENI